MLNRKRVVLVVLLAFGLFLALGFPTRTKMAGRSPRAHSAASLRGSRPGSGLPPPAARRALADESLQVGLSLKVPRRDHTATALTDGRVIIIGGDNQAGPVAEAEMLDTSSQTVSVVAKLQEPRALHAATLLEDGTVMVTGGFGQGGPLDSSEFFDPRTNS